MPWIHVDDVVGMLLHASQSDSIKGPLNAAAPAPIRNSEFTRALGRAIHRPTFMPVPKAALRIALGQMAAIITASQRVVPALAEESGYDFQYPVLDRAIADVVDTTVAAKAA